MTILLVKLPVKLQLMKLPKLPPMMKLPKVPPMMELPKLPLMMKLEMVLQHFLGHLFLAAASSFRYGTLIYSNKSRPSLVLDAICVKCRVFLQ